MRRVAIPLFLGVLVVAPRAHADDDVGAPIAAVQRDLDAGRAPASRLRGGWLITHGALTLGQTGVGLLEDAKQRPALFVGAAKSAIGFLAVLLSPLPAATAGAELRAMPEDTEGARSAKLARARALLDESADKAQFARGFFAHAGSVLVNGAGAIVLWRGYHQPGQGALSFVTGMAVAELQIFTVPTGVITARDARASVSIAPTIGGVAVFGVF